MVTLQGGAHSSMMKTQFSLNSVFADGILKPVVDLVTGSAQWQAVPTGEADAVDV